MSNHRNNSGSSNGRPCPWTLFNAKLIDFVDDLQGVLGHLPEYTVFASSARLLSQFQLRQNQGMFDRYVAKPYGAFIVARNEAFLLDQDFSDVTGGGSQNDGIVSLLKSVWTSLPQEDKESIWAHMQVLLVLNDRCK
jgi:hypothetical protein